jgi:hypothetical protein
MKLTCGSIKIADMANGAPPNQEMSDFVNQMRLELGGSSA